MVFRFRRVLMLVLVLCLCNLVRAEDTSLAVFPLSGFEGDIITVPVRVGEEEHLFMLDSGASKHVFDRSIRHLLSRQLNSVVIGAAGGKNVEVERFASPSATIGDVPLDTTCSVLCTDLSFVCEESGYDVRGCLGVPLFRTQIVQLDFERRQLRILPTNIEPMQEWGQPVAIVHRNGHRPMIELECGGGLKALCEIDTGYNGDISLSSRLYDQLAEAGMIESDEDSATRDLTGTTQHRAGLLSTVKCGADYHSGIRASETSGKNKVGTGFLSRYAITFDCLRNTAYFAPNRSFRPRKSVGIIAHRKSDGMTIEAVKPGSPADRAGVRPQDKLTAVAGTVVHRQPTAEIMSLIQEGASSDGDVKLTVDRGGVVEVLILKLD